MTTCTACDGRRTVSITVPNMLGPSNNQYQSNNPPYVTRNYQCHDCHGTGRIECVRCMDTGLVETSDGYGGYDSTSPMQCDCETAKSQIAAHNARMARERDLAYSEPF